MIYFMSCDEVPQCPIKIGWSNNPEERREHLSKGSPYPLKIIGMVHSPFEGEGLLHIHFAEERLHGEWFRRSSRLESWIKDNAFSYAEWEEREIAWMQFLFKHHFLG